MAVLAAVNVSPLEPLPFDRVFAENLAVTPVGRLLAESVTAELNPFCPVTDIVACPDVPGNVFTEAALVERAKVGAGLMVRGILSDPVKPLPLAVNMTVYFPGRIAALLLNASVEGEPGVRVLPEIPADMPAGIPFIDTAKGALKVPTCDPQVTCRLAPCPAVNVAVEGLADRVQLVGAVIARFTLDVCVTPPPVAVTVMV